MTGRPGTGLCRRYLRIKLGVLGLTMVAVVFLGAVFAPVLAPMDPSDHNLRNTLAAPSSQHWFGTDELGRDQLSRVIYGSRPALAVGFAAVPVAFVIAVALGSVAGFLGRRWDTVIMRIADMFYAFPSLIALMLIVLLLGRGLPSVVLAVWIFGWVTMARVLRASILSIRDAEFVEAARAMGASSFRIVARHILPNTLGPVVMMATVRIGTAVGALAGLSFLGIGVEPGTADWGSMIAAGHKFYGVKNYLWLFPSLALSFSVLGFMFIGDGLRDALDPGIDRTRRNRPNRSPAASGPMATFSAPPVTSNPTAE